MVDDEFCSVVFIGEILVKLWEDARLDHTLVNDGARAEGCNINLRQSLSTELVR